MAIIATQKKTVFNKVKKAIKNVLKIAFPVLNQKKSAKKNRRQEELERVDFDVEINDNIHNEALEARFIQIIEASPAVLNLPKSPKSSGSRGALYVNSEYQVCFGTFWAGDEEDTWDRYPELCKFNSNMRNKIKPASVTPTSSITEEPVRSC